VNASVVRRLARRVDTLKRWLTRAYRLEVRFEAEHYLIAPEAARALLPQRSPRSGVLALEEAGTLWLGLYLDPCDRGRLGALVEETSHLVCLAWHAELERSVSRLALELQAEVDQYLVGRLWGRDGLAHFRSFRWARWMDAPTRERYETAHRVAHRYCRSLSRRFPQRADTPGLLRELRDFYRAPAEQKLRAGA
jgi:hypothetical protein